MRSDPEVAPPAPCRNWFTSEHTRYRGFLSEPVDINHVDLSLDRSGTAQKATPPQPPSAPHSSDTEAVAAVAVEDAAVMAAPPVSLPPPMATPAGRSGASHGQPPLQGGPVAVPFPSQESSWAAAVQLAHHTSSLAAAATMGPSVPQTGLPALQVSPAEDVFADEHPPPSSAAPGSSEGAAAAAATRPIPGWNPTLPPVLPSTCVADPRGSIQHADVAPSKGLASYFGGFPEVPLQSSLEKPLADSPATGSDQASGVLCVDDIEGESLPFARHPRALPHACHDSQRCPMLVPLRLPFRVDSLLLVSIET